jgi:hypothetical protein
VLPHNLLQGQLQLKKNLFAYVAFAHIGKLSTWLIHTYHDFCLSVMVGLF